MQVSFIIIDSNQAIRGTIPMPVYGDFRLIQSEDALDTFSMQNPTPIGSWDLQVYVSKRFGIGSSGLIVASAASGYGGGQSGITITNSGNGTFTFPINSPATSGWQAGNYATVISRLDSGYNSVLFLGYLILGPR